MPDRLTLADLVALRDECVAFRAEIQKRHDSGWTYNKPAWRLWGNAESLLSELVERREREAVVRPCQHRFTANPGMYDTSHPYCEICGVAEGCEPPSAARSE